MNKSDIIKFLILRTLGNFLLLFSLFGVIATFGPALYYEVQFRIAQARGIHYKVVDAEKTQKPTLLGELSRRQEEEKLAQTGFAAVLTGPKEQVLIPKDTLFSILIPKIGANSLVVPNIDATKESEFISALQRGVAHAKGTVFPGQKGNVYLFAHSADNFWDAGRYNAVFYLLKDLTKEDNIVVFFENVRHNYEVVETKTANPEEVSYLVKSQEGQEETLILQTCWPPGTTWKRLLVIAKPKK